jgi:hypothetical protein
MPPPLENAREECPLFPLLECAVPAKAATSLLLAELVAPGLHQTLTAARRSLGLFSSLEPVADLYLRK